MVIDISGIDKAAILAVLYNHAKPQRLGYIHRTPEDMTIAQARELLNGGHTYFDYLKGRVLKVDLSGNTLRTAAYNRDNGAGMVEYILHDLLATKDQG